MKYARISKLFNAAAIASIAATLPLNITFAANSAEGEGNSLLVLGAVALIVGLALALFGFRHFKQYQNEQDEDTRKRGVLMAAIMFAVALSMFGLGGWSVMSSSSNATLAGAGIQDAPIAVSGDELNTAAGASESEAVAAPSVVVRDEQGNVVADNSVSDNYSAFSLELGGHGQGDLASAAPPELIIPDLDLERSVVTVPITNGEWDLEGLDHNIGWLASTGAKPNDDFAMVLAAHVTLTASETGPFHKLATMAPGSRFTYRWDGVDYIYEMGAKRVVSPDAVRDLYVEDGSKLILVTCTTWDPSLEAYSERVLAEATLVEQVPAPSTNTN